jgi:hypothetical protein
MHAEEHQKQWPVISQSDVADICGQVCESIIGLERAFEAGELSSKLTSGCFDHVAGPLLYNTYGRLAESAPGPLHHLRVEAVRALLAQLQNDLLPIHVAHGRVRISPEGDSWPAEIGAEARPKSPLFVDASLDGASSATLRFRQMLDARFWRIGFTFETLDLQDAFAQALVRTATVRLASDLRGLQQIVERLSKRTLDDELRIVPYPAERRFEHLMLDILNEDEHHANVAPLVEDFFEKTDLRVKYRGLKRTRGGRVQVTSIVAPELHETKLQAIKLAEEFVFLSPLSLAQFVGSLKGPSSPAISISGTPPFALAPLWDCLEGRPADIPQLAAELKRITHRALAGTPDSAHGPMTRVPLPIRQLIRLFVETHAIASTNRLRERERVNSRNLASSGDELSDV